MGSIHVELLEPASLSQLLLRLDGCVYVAGELGFGVDEEKGTWSQEREWVSKDFCVAFCEELGEASSLG
jgi:hypothetical protein